MNNKDENKKMFKGFLFRQLLINNNYLTKIPTKFGSLEFDTEAVDEVVSELTDYCFSVEKFYDKEYILVKNTHEKILPSVFLVSYLSGNRSLCSFEKIKEYKEFFDESRNIKFESVINFDKKSSNLLPPYSDGEIERMKKL